MKVPKQADLTAQEAAAKLQSEESEEIALSFGKKVKVGWIRTITQDKMDTIFVWYEKQKKECGEDISKGNKATRIFYAKMVAAILLNHPWKLALWWWAKWRIIYKYWALNGDDYLMLITEAKKKAAEQQFYLAMALAMSIPDVWTMMTRKEAEAYRQELSSEKEQPS